MIPCSLRHSVFCTTFSCEPIAEHLLPVTLWVKVSYQLVNLLVIGYLICYCWHLIWLVSSKFTVIASVKVRDLLEADSAPCFVIATSHTMLYDCLCIYFVSYLTIVSVFILTQ